MLGFDSLQKALSSILQPGEGTVVIPNDASNLTGVPATGATLYIGVQGNLKVDLANGSTITYKNVQGTFSRRVKKVYATGTTAIDIIADY